MDVNNPITAFAMLGSSFFGKWVGGYTSCKGASKNAALATKNTTLKYRKGIEGVDFRFKSYLDYTPVNMLIYCDPPYANTTKYKSGKFNSEQFWQTMREWSVNNTVITSEYTAPDDFKIIHEFDHVLSIRSKKGCEPRIERLFKYESRR
jgi:DNA adenine methylase